MMLTCPICRTEFDLTELKREWGWTAKLRCPNCNGQVLLKPPYGLAVGLLSLLIALGALRLYGVRSVNGYVVGTIVIWVPVSLYLNLESHRIKAPTLTTPKQWTPKPRRRTFFEWLYDRDAPQDLFNRRRH
jgi:DNA-directed RNA polymerase subunit RPC12/RpoP